MATRKKGSGNNGRGQQQQQRRQQDQGQQHPERRADQRADQGAEHADELAGRARHMAMQADRSVRQTIDRRPMTAVWTSFGLGLGLGLALVALMPGRRGDWSLGDWSLDDLTDSLGDLGHRAGSIGRSAAGHASDYAHDLGERASHYAHDLGDVATRRAREAAGYLGF